MSYISAIFYNFAIGAIKFSVLAFYLRIGDRALRMASMVMFVVVAMQTIAFMVVCAALCKPVWALWNPRLFATGRVKCIDFVGFFRTSAVINVITDFIIYLLPARVLWILRIPLQQKIGLTVVLSLGLL